MSRPRLLDLYACEGGAARGYELAGWDVYGVDLFAEFTQARYPYPSVKSDALTFLKSGGWLGFDAIHASPPCQHASAGTRAMRSRGDSRHPALIEPTRALLERTGLPYVMENVKGAALRDPAMLCGSMFGLTAMDDDGTLLHLQRHRLFESNVTLNVPTHRCWPRSVQIAGSYGGARRDKEQARNVRHGGYVPSKAVQQTLMGIDWMTERGMHQALPPAYTEHIGAQLLAHVREVAA